MIMQLTYRGNIFSNLTENAITLTNGNQCLKAESNRKIKKKKKTETDGLIKHLHELLKPRYFKTILPKQFQNNNKHLL